MMISHALPSRPGPWLQLCAPSLTRTEALQIYQWKVTPDQLQGPKTPKPEIPSKKKLKNYPPAPDPKLLEKNSKNTKNTRKIVVLSIFSIFEFFSRNLGSGAGG